MYIKLNFCHTGYIFTAGCRDRLVRAFQMRKTKFKSCGVLEIPRNLGSATGLACNDKTLFVGTEKNTILSVELILKPTFDVFSSLPNNPITPPHHFQQSVSSKSLLSKHSSIHAAPQQSKENDEESIGIFSSWDEDEVARGFGKGIVCVCPITRLKMKLRTRKSFGKNT